MPRYRRLMLSMSTVLFLAFALQTAIARPGQESEPTEADRNDRLAPFVPTPETLVEAMLQIANVNKNDVVYDLGSGDGRIVIMAAQKYQAQAVGVEIDNELFRQSSSRISELGLAKRAKILHMNMYKVDLKPATVVTLYLLTSVNERLKPILERDLRSGARVVTHDFKIPGWEPVRVQDINTESTFGKRIYLYVRP